MDVRAGGLDDPQVIALIALHRAQSHAATPVGNAHALGADGLRAPDIVFFGIWDGATLLGIGALRRLSRDHAEIKSMRTAPGHLRRGDARALLRHLIAAARAGGCTRISLETGTAPMFDAANRLYDHQGFTDCAAFGDYPASAHSRFMTLVL